jgi:hypothetical protein
MREVAGSTPGLDFKGNSLGLYIGSIGSYEAP